MIFQPNDYVFLKSLRKKAKIREILEETQTVRLSYWAKDNKLCVVEVYLTDIEPLRPKKKRDIVYFAKVRPSAIIPSKIQENAGYDFYCDFEMDELRLVKGKANMIPTGIASAMSSKYYLNLKHERGSTGKLGMSLLSGVCDSGYRGEIFLNVVPTDKDVVISKTYDFPVKDGKVKSVELEAVIMYPYSLAIAQGTIEFVPNVEIKEITYEELEKIPSERGKGKLGASGK